MRALILAAAAMLAVASYAAPVQAKMGLTSQQQFQVVLHSTDGSVLRDETKVKSRYGKGKSAITKWTYKSNSPCCKGNKATHYYKGGDRISKARAERLISGSKSNKGGKGKK